MITSTLHFMKEILNKKDDYISPRTVEYVIFVESCLIKGSDPGGTEDPNPPVYD